MPTTRSMRNAGKTVALKVEAPKKQPRKSKYDIYLTPVCKEVGIPLNRMPKFRIVYQADGASNPLEVKLTVQCEEDKVKLLGYLEDDWNFEDNLSDLGYELFESCGGKTDVGVDWYVLVKKW